MTWSLMKSIMTPICNHWPVIISTCFLQLSRDQTSLAFQPRPLFCHPMFLGRRPLGKAILCSFFPILVFATFHLFLQGNEAYGGKWSGGYGGSSIVRQSLSASWGFASNCSTLWYNQRIKRLLSKPVFYSLFVICNELMDLLIRKEKNRLVHQFKTQRPQNLFLIQFCVPFSRFTRCSTHCVPFLSPQWIR